MDLTLPSALVETDWLAERLDQSGLRILDCTVILGRDASGALSLESGRAGWEQGHIPGSAFADLIHDLSAPSDAPQTFPFPPAEQFAAAMGRLSVGDDSTVVLYDQQMSTWAARLWWLLHAYGFDRAAVLNGGWHRWSIEGRPISTEPPSYPPAHFTARPRPELIADKDEVLGAIDNRSRLLINALSPDDFSGRRASPSRRPGHIPSSVNVPASGSEGIVDPETHAYLPLDALRQRFAAVGLKPGQRAITYCGAGIAASSAALALHLIGAPDIAVYDGSLSEWAADPDLPLETE